MKARRSWAATVVMIPLACLVGVPFYYIAVNTFKTAAQSDRAPLAWPSPWYFGNYRNIFENVPVFGAFLNTLVITIGAILLMLLIGSMAAYGMTTHRSRINTWLRVVFVIVFAIPFQATLIPLYQMWVAVHLVDSLIGLILLYCAGSVFCYFLIAGYIKTVPYEIVEAAKVDGAGHFRIYWQIVIPLIRPILTTVGVFQTMWVWNDFITPNVFISSPQNQTLVLQVYTAVSQFTVNWPAFMTLTVIVLVPMVVFFFVMQRHIMSGLVTGSIRG